MKNVNDSLDASGDNLISLFSCTFTGGETRRFQERVDSASHGDWLSRWTSVRIVHTLATIGDQDRLAPSAHTHTYEFDHVPTRC